MLLVIKLLSDCGIDGRLYPELCLMPGYTPPVVSDTVPNSEEQQGEDNEMDS